jgi:glycosyltransferase involved in cell wall biosynthesis
MNLVFISSDNYPDTHAAAIRHTTLAKGLVEQGHTASFIILSPQNWTGKTELNYLGIHFKTVNHYTGTNKLLKNYYKIKAVFEARRIIRQKHAAKQVDALVIFTIEVIPIRYLMKAAHHLGLKVFHERTELPYAVGNQSKKGKALLKVYLDKLLPRFDGVFVISDKLVQYIGQFNNSVRKLLTVVDLSFFATDKQSPYPFPYIGYCGTISGKKDGVPILVEAFSLIREQFPLVKLVLVGNDTNKEGIRDTLDAITRLGLENQVVFTGLVDREMMPVILCNAQILVVAKPDNEQNSGNFPIKIGEYLATGIPIVVTSVGEIPLYIKDGESGYLAEPGSAASFAEKMREALANPVKARQVGMNGKLVAQKLFDYRLQSAIMADFISEINKRS